MRVSAFSRLHRSRRYLALGLAVASIAPLSGCRDLVRRTREAESISISPPNIEVPVNSSVRVVGTAFDRDGNTIGNKTIRYSTANTTIATVTPDGLVIGVSPGQTIVSAAADDARGETTVTVTPEIPASVQVLPSPVTLRRGNIRQFTATPKTASGADIVGRTFTWQSSNASVASVSQTGEVTAVAPGNVTISATTQNVFGSAQVTVTEIPIGSISLAPTTRNLIVGETFQPTVTLRDTANNVISALGRSLGWTSSDQTIATVNSNGVVNAIRAGSATITANSPQDPAISGDMSVVISNRVVRNVVISTRTGSLRLGIPRTLQAQALDSINSPIQGKTVTWGVLTPTTVTVSQNGVATGISLGQARITATADGIADTVTFTVNRVPVRDVTVSPLAGAVVANQTLQLTAIVEDSTGAEVTDRVVQWLTSDVSRASVSNTGLVTGISPGNVTITANSEGRTGSASLVILQVPVDSVRLFSAADANIAFQKAADGQPAATRVVQFTLTDALGNQILNRNVVINVSNPSIVNTTWTQNTSRLTLTALEAGTTTITLRAIGGTGSPEGKTTTITVTVTPPPVDP